MLAATGEEKMFPGSNRAKGKERRGKWGCRRGDSVCVRCD